MAVSITEICANQFDAPVLVLLLVRVKLGPQVSKAVDNVLDSRQDDALWYYALSVAPTAEQINYDSVFYVVLLLLGDEC